MTRLRLSAMKPPGTTMTAAPYPTAMPLTSPRSITDRQDRNFSTHSTEKCTCTLTENNRNTPLLRRHHIAVPNSLSSKHTISDAYNYIIGPYAKDRTQKLRSISDRSRARNYKSANFDYATFCGEFTCRKNDALKSDSGLLCIDFDHVPDIETLFARLLQDEYFTTDLLFRSPSGDGLKWIIGTDRSQRKDPRFFKALEHYSLQTYGIRPDASGKDIARACFLPYDPNAYINPKYR